MEKNTTEHNQSSPSEKHKHTQKKTGITEKADRAGSSIEELHSVGLIIN